MVVPELHLEPWHRKADELILLLWAALAKPKLEYYYDQFCTVPSKTSVVHLARTWR